MRSHSSSKIKSLKKMRYIRHTPQQRKHMEEFFLTCPNPNDKQRKELGRLLDLEPEQIKFWFQNKRTRTKCDLERNENDELRLKNIELRFENEKMRKILFNTKCCKCGGPAQNQMAFVEQYIRQENDFLRKEIERVKGTFTHLVIELETSNPDMSSSQESTRHWTSLNQRDGNVTFHQHNNMPETLLNQGASNVSPQEDNMLHSLIDQELGNFPSQENMPPSFYDQILDNLSYQDFSEMLLSFLKQGVDSFSSQDNDMMPMNAVNSGLDNLPSEDNGMLMSVFNQGHDDTLATQNNVVPPSLLNQGLGNQPSEDNNGMPPSLINHELDNLPFQGVGHESSQNNDMLLSFLSQEISDMPAEPVAGLVGQMDGGGSDPLRSSSLLLVPFENSDKPMIMELAVQSMKELTRIALEGQPLWVYGKYNADILNELEYLMTSTRAIGPKLLGFRSESSKECMVVSMNHINLIEILMDVDQWSRVFCDIVSRAEVLEVVSEGLGGSYDGYMQVISAEFQAPSPFVPPREYNFVRYCKQLPDSSWAVVDASLESIRPTAVASASRRRPSGCLIEALSDGFSTKVTWVEHVEVDDRMLRPHFTYAPLVESTLSFGAKRWMASLDRQCERIASTLATTIPPHRLYGILANCEGRKGLLKLAERMVMSFFSGVGASTSPTWKTLTPIGHYNNTRIITRKGKDNPGIPPGIVICAATSFRLAVPSQRAFNCIRSATLRNQWDVLAIEGNAEEFTHIENGRNPANCVSLFRVKSSNPMHKNLIIVQETIKDDSTGSFVVYAPIDNVSYENILGGKPADSLPMLPAGLAILPDVGASGCKGCLVTLAFQILVESDSTRGISLSSLGAVNSLINNTVQRIKVVAMSNRI